jgi:ABC-type transporter Mla subunit MlaD
MALQDLTPQLRTRMSRVERLVGLFVVLAGLLMIAGFAYYLVHAGKKRGWFVRKVPYWCYTSDAVGLKLGDPVRLLGRDVGRIIKLETTDPNPWAVQNHWNVFVKFEVWDPYFRYILTDSKVRVVSADFFGARLLEITPGDQNVGAITVTAPPRWEDTQVLNPKDTNSYIALGKVNEGVWIQNVEELPAVAARAESIVLMLAEAFPRLTNQISQVLAHASDATSNANLALVDLKPVLTNLQTLATRLSTEQGVIGNMLLSSNLNGQVEQNLAAMSGTLTNTTALIRTSEIQLQDLTRRIGMTLDSVALVTSNLSAQVAANGLFLGEVSSLVVDADHMVQGLKTHWLLRSAFQGQTNAPIESVVQPSLDGPPRP